MTAVPPNPPSVPESSPATEGVAAMIPVANITLEDALLDNPNFRANMKLFEGQVYFIEGWLVALQQSIKKVTEEWEKLNEVTAILNKRAEVPLLSQGMLSAQYTIPAMKLVGGAFRTMLALKHQYIVAVNERIIKPLEDFLKNDLKEFKESKKVFDKALEKYESSLAKYSGQSRQKEPSALREEAFQLYDVRKTYIQASMTCAMLCIKFQDSLDQLILGLFLDIMATQHDYFSGNADHCGSMALQVLQLKTYMREHGSASGIALAELQQTKERYTTDAIEYWKPSRSLKSYCNNAPVTKQSTIGPALMNAIHIAGPTHVMPYLTQSTALTRTSTLESQRSTLGNHPSMPNIASEDVSNDSSLTLPQSKSLDNVAPVDAQASSTTTTTDATDQGPQPASSNSSSITNLVLCENTNDVTPTTKQGYLNIRIPQPKNKAPVWQRKYFFIQEGEFGFESVVSSPSVGSQVVQSERISVLLCEVRHGNSSPGTMNGNGNTSTSSQGLAMVQMERRFCFEVVCSTQSYLLQAETEEDLLSWVDTFEAAKREALMQQHLPKFSDGEEPYSPMPMTETGNTRFHFSPEDQLESDMNANGRDGTNGTQQQDSKASGPLGWAASVPGFSLLLNTYTGSNANNSGADSAPPTGGDASNGTDATEKPEENSHGPSAAIPVTVTSDASNNASSSPSVTPPPADSSMSNASRKARDPLPMLDTKRRAPSETKVATLSDAGAAATAAEATSGTTDLGASAQSKSSGTSQTTHLEKLMNSAHHLVPKSVVSTTADIPHYPMELVVRNRELHHRFMGTKLHKKEYVLHSWAGGYWDDCRSTPIMVYGRIYLTQLGIYFYSRDLSIETRRMFRFSAIQGIECEQKDIFTEWRIETLDGHQHIFSQFTLTDTEYLVLKLIWTNAHSRTSRLPVKDLFRKTMKITSKPKLTAGSGSLAETESTHSTQTQGIVHHGNRSSLTAPPKDSASEGANGVDQQLRRDQDGDLSDLASSQKYESENVFSNPEDAFPADMQPPPGPVDCQCAGHLERTDTEKVFKVPAKTLKSLLFGPSSPVWREFHDRRNNTLHDIGEWVQEGGRKTRMVKFLMVVNNPMVKLNQTDCVETQTCEVEEEHLRYSYTVRSSVPAMPYSDAFTPVTRYCITYVSPTESKLTCSSGIEWHKNPLMKAVIKGAIIKGTAETARDLNEILEMQIASGGNTGVARSGRRSGSRSRSRSSSLFSTHKPTRPRHDRSNSSRVKIALVEPGANQEKMLLDSEYDDSEHEGHGNVPATARASNNIASAVAAAAAATATAAAAAARTLGSGTTNTQRGRRHTVSAAAYDNAAPFAHPDTQARVKGEWPRGEQPKFVPLGSKESRTRLLGRPSRTILVADMDKGAGTVAGAQDNGGTRGGLLYRLLYGSSAALKDETPVQQQRRLLVRLLVFFLVISSLMNVWAAWNSKRLIESTWRIQRQEMILQGIELKNDSKGVLSTAEKQLQQAWRLAASQRGSSGQDSSNLFSTKRKMRVSTRAVFLKDLEDQVLSTSASKDFEDGLIDGPSFKSFLQVKETFHPWAADAVLSPSSSATPASPCERADATASTSIVPVSIKDRPNDSCPSSRSTSYPWILPSHKRRATRLVFQRDRLGILRYDLLATFERLNQLEQRLIEAEYINWIMDEKLRCRMWAVKTGKDQSWRESDSYSPEGGNEDQEGSQVMDPRLTDEVCTGVDRQLQMLSHPKKV